MIFEVILFGLSGNLKLKNVISLTNQL